MPGTPCVSSAIGVASYSNLGADLTLLGAKAETTTASTRSPDAMNVITPCARIRSRSRVFGLSGELNKINDHNKLGWVWHVIRPGKVPNQQLKQAPWHQGDPQWPWLLSKGEQPQDQG